MELILYAIIFIMGTVFGSFFSLAVYRIPLGQDITHKRSYCPKCNHRLEFLDMIPVFSYLFLKGKCRYCKETVRPRYLILEVLSGITFVLFALSLNLNFSILEINKLVYLLIGILYICGLFIIAGIDKENKSIPRSVIIYTVIVLATYMLYLYIVQKANIYRYVIYLFIMLIFIIIDTIILRKKGKNNYNIQIVILCLLLSLFTDELIFVVSAILTLLTITFVLILNKIKFKKYKKAEQELNLSLPVGFYLSVNTIIVLILSNFMLYYR